MGARLGVDINVAILEKALTLELRHFEDGRFYDSLLKARREASFRPVSVVTEGEFRASVPHPLFDVDVPEAASPYPTHYAVTADGQRFILPSAVGFRSAEPPGVVLNWIGGVSRPGQE